MRGGCSSKAERRAMLVRDQPPRLSKTKHNMTEKQDKDNTDVMVGTTDSDKWYN